MLASVRVKTWILAISLAVLTAPATANMLISPTRVLLDDDNRSATMTLRNTSDGARTFRLEWEDKRVDDQGRYVMVEPGEEWPSAKGMVRHAPRQITVGPKENQTVRFSWRPPADLPDGEYRSHLLLKIIPEVSEPTATFGKKAKEGEIGIQLHMQMSFSVPVVVRHNTQPPQVAISNVQVVPAKDGENMRLKVTLERSGSRASSYGKLVVEMQRDANSPVERIGEVRELSLFHEVSRREVSVGLRDKSIPAGTWIRVAYEGIKEYRGLLWDEKVFQTE